MKVMIATDGTEAAVHAARRAVDLLHPDAKIELVTVIPARPDPMEDAGGIEGPAITDREADEEWNRAVSAGRDALERTERAMEVEVDEAKLVPTTERTDQALIALVQEERPALLVLGSRELGWFDRVLRGSVGERLLHHAPCPLLIVGREG
jgi:nucleotide-binding universal stress UspA family protein